MRKIVDANYFSDPRLSSYLSKRRSNKVVLNEYALIEAYKGNALKNVIESNRVLSRYPDQVIVLKCIRPLIRMNGDPKGLQSRLIDKIATKGFEQFCLYLQIVEKGDPHLESQILQHAREASKRIDTMGEEGVSGLLELIRAIKGIFSPDELKDFRVKGIGSEMIYEKLSVLICRVFENTYRDHPDTSGSPNVSRIPYLYLYRLSMCWTFLALKLLADGGSEHVRRAHLINHMVDVNYVATATYFDGILTKDRKMREMYDDATRWLRHIVV